MISHTKHQLAFLLYAHVSRFFFNFDCFYFRQTGGYCNSNSQKGSQGVYFLSNINCSISKKGRGLLNNATGGKEEMLRLIGRKDFF